MHKDDLFTCTGRLPSRSPNLQGIRPSSQEFQRIRSAFTQPANLSSTLLRETSMELDDTYNEIIGPDWLDRAEVRGLFQRVRNHELTPLEFISEMAAAVQRIGTEEQKKALADDLAKAMPSIAYWKRGRENYDDLMVTKAKLDAQPDDEKWKQLAKDGCSNIEAVKELRAKEGLGLREAYQMVAAYQEQIGLPHHKRVR